MSDIDFEELDRAVSSLMNPDGEPEPQPMAQDHAASSSLEQPGSRVSTPDSELVEPSSPKVSPAAPLAARRSGRFMDVIPNQSSRQALSRGPASRPGSRVTTILEPDAATSSVLTDDKTVEESVHHPLDGTAQSSELGLDDQTIDAATGTPFLEGVSVDKRPLGHVDSQESDLLEQGSADQDLISEEPQAEELLDTETEGQATDEIDSIGEDLSSVVNTDPWSSEPEADDSTMPQIEEVLRPELSPELLAMDAMPVSTETPAVDTESSDSKTEVDETAKSAGDVPMIVAGDIAPQYSSSPSEAPEPSPIFEAASQAPEPLAHPAKKKSGWSTVVWILLMVVLGVAGGIAVWYFLVK